MRRTVGVLVFFGVMSAFVGLAFAQDGVRDVSNPFQEEFEFKVGQTLDLEIRLNGLRWIVLRASAGDNETWEAGKKVKTTFSNEMENLTDTPLTLSAILLLEDERGRQLERVELKRIRVGDGRYTEDIQKIKIDGGVLSETSKIYVFAEVK